MTKTTARNMFVVGTVFFSIVFLYLTYDSLKQMPKRTNEDKLTEAVVAGKHAWQDHNCNDCHTILGIGGYYAPDVTKVAKYRDRDWLRRFLKDPQGVWAAKRKMPDLHLSDMEIDGLIAFMEWVSEIDTNNWPPKPLAFAAATVAKKGAEGERLFALNGCQGCHMINGVGGKAGPDLTHVGSRLPDVEWHAKHLKDPQSVHPESAMPAFGSLPEEQVEALAEYLAGLK